MRNTAPDKRARLVDRLLTTPQHARQLATFFDLMLMERRPQKHVDLGAWQQFLFASCLTNKPYHQLVREILSADGADEATRPAARFLLDREGEPSTLVRDTGRILFGMDLSCAQCHDHPNVPDYVQRDYHGLFAFFNRTYLFTRDRDKKAFVCTECGKTAQQPGEFTAHMLEHGITFDTPLGKALAKQKKEGSKQ